MHLEASHSFLFFDYFRVPHRRAPSPILSEDATEVWGQIRDSESGKALWWLRTEAKNPIGLLGAYRMRTLPIFGRVVPDVDLNDFLATRGAGWDPVEAIVDASGAVVSHVWRSAAGDLVLPFDPAQTMVLCWSEGYKRLIRPDAYRAAEVLVRAYYRARPLIPRTIQLRMRRSFTSIQKRADFPAWPIEDGLHDLFDWLFQQTAELTNGPVPWLDLWPDDRSWAFVLTHDVDTQEGFDRIELLRSIERQSDRVSSWNIVPERYRVADSVLEGLRGEGCEIGLHGLRHDGRDIGSLRTFEARLPAMRSYAERWNAVGFRSPSTNRMWDWMPRLGLDYDSSYPDTDPYEPTPGGACSYFPFMNREMVELPITLPQDHTLLFILQQPDATLWIDKARHIRDRRGMALIITHPDYAHDERVLAGYKRLLDEFADDGSVWCALPRQVSAWWRQRGDSHLEATSTGWEIRGSASERGRVRFAGHHGTLSGSGS